MQTSYTCGCTVLCEHAGGCSIIKAKLKSASLSYFLRLNVTKGSQDPHPSPTPVLSPAPMWAPWGAERTMDLAPSPALLWPLDSLGEPANLLGSPFPPQ